MSELLQRMLDAMAAMPKRKEWSEMSAEERIAEAIDHGAELRVSGYIEPGHIAAHRRPTFLPGYDRPSEEYVVYVGDEATREGLITAFLEAKLEKPAKGGR